MHGYSFQYYLQPVLGGGDGNTLKFSDKMNGNLSMFQNSVD